MTGSVRHSTRENNNSSPNLYLKNHKRDIGVSQFPSGGWDVDIDYPQKTIRPGLMLRTYDTPEDAALAYDEAAYALERQRARLNFPRLPAQEPAADAGESSQNHSGTGKASMCKKKFVDGESSQKLQLPIEFLKAEGPVSVRKKGKVICGGSRLDEFVCRPHYDEATAFRSRQLDGASSQEHARIQADHDLASSIELASTPLNEDASASDSNHQSVRASASPPEDRDIENRVALSRAQSMKEESPFDFDKLNKLILLLSTEECLALLAILFSGGSSLSTNVRILMRGAGISSAVGFYSSLGSSILKHIGKAEPAAPFLTALGGATAACGFTFLSCLFLPEKLMLIFASVICTMNIFILPFIFIKKS